jgi:hypothetical protein
LEASRAGSKIGFTPIDLTDVCCARKRHGGLRAIDNA